MYGLKKDQKNAGVFVFDLEMNIKEKPAEGKKLLEKATKRQQEIKTTLRTGVNDKDFDTLGILLHGYTALQKILKKITP